MRFLVTGGAGFIGSALCRYLVGELRQSVVNVDCLTYASTLSSLASIADDPLYTFVQADICDRAAMTDALTRYEPDAVIHLAAESHVDRSIAAAQVFSANQCDGNARACWRRRAAISTRLGRRSATRSAFSMCRPMRSMARSPRQGLFSEQSAYDPSSPYSASKAAADHLVRAWHRTYGVPAIISNCSNNYGPFHFPEKLIPLTILNASEGKKLPVYGDGSNIRDWLYVEDHARALHLIVGKGRPGEKYNVGGANERSNIQVVRRICELMDQLSPSGAPHQRLITFVEDRPGHDHRYAIDAAKI